MYNNMYARVCFLCICACVCGFASVFACVFSVCVCVRSVVCVRPAVPRPAIDGRHLRDSRARDNVASLPSNRHLRPEASDLL